MKSIGQNWRGTWPTTSFFTRRNTVLLAFGFLLACVLGYEPLASRSARRSAVVRHQPTQGTGAGPHTPLLQIQSVVRHGRVVEVRGRTAPKTTIMINGERAAVFDDWGFKHFVGPLPSGLTIISVTAQNEGGGVNTEQVAVYIE